MKKISTLFLLTVAAASAAFAQQTAPQPAPKPDKNVMIWTSGEDGGYLGIQGVGITNENLSQYGLKEARGVGIEKVMENSPAEKAGLQKGDVIVRFDGEDVKSVSKLTRMITEVSPDQKARLTIIRNGDEREITVTMGKRQPFVFERGQLAPGFQGMQALPAMPNMPDMKDLPKMQEFKLNDEMFKGQNFEGFPKDGTIVWNFLGGRRIGIQSEALTKQLADHFGVADGKGLLVTDVRADSPAAKAGLKAGDIIVEANGKPISEANDLIRQINSKKDGDVEITFIRDKNRQTIKVTPEDAKQGLAPVFGDEPNFKAFAVPQVSVAPISPSVAPIAPVAMPVPAIKAVRVM